MIPDGNRTREIYFCQGTDRASFKTNALGCEMQLAQEIFNGHTDRAPKIKCAICLLRGHQQNGFVAITSKLEDGLEQTIQTANDAKKEKSNLHSDHSDFVFACKMSSLTSPGKYAETLNQMGRDDVCQIKLGHHLESFVWILDNKQN